MTYLDICTKKTYEKNGEQKTIWLKVGVLKITPEGKKFIDLAMFPDTNFYVFEQKKKEDTL